MKNLAFIAALAIFAFTSCTNYQYVQVKSSLPKTSDTEHYYQADENVYVDFDFAGYGLPVQLFMVNESNDAIYFDLENTMFYENGESITSAAKLSHPDSSLIILIKPQASITFKCFPFQREYSNQYIAQSQLENISVDAKSRYIQVARFDDQEQTFDVEIAYRKGSEFSTIQFLKASFWQSEHYYTTKSPHEVPLALTPNVYVLNDHNIAGQIASELLFDVAAASLTYLILEGLE